MFGANMFCVVIFRNADISRMCIFPTLGRDVLAIQQGTPKSQQVINIYDFSNIPTAAYVAVLFNSNNKGEYYEKH